MVSLTSIFIVFLGYFAGVKFGPVPTSLVSLVVGSSIAWIAGDLKTQVGLVGVGGIAFGD